MLNAGADDAALGGGVLDKRIQLELRKVTDTKVAEGFEIIRREPTVILKRGTTIINLEYVNGKVIIKSGR